MIMVRVRLMSRVKFSVRSGVRLRFMPSALQQMLVALSWLELGGAGTTQEQHWGSTGEWGGQLSPGRAQPLRGDLAHSTSPWLPTASATLGDSA